MVRKFIDTFPDYKIDFHFTVGTTGEILDGLKSDQYDIVFSSFQDGEPDIDFKKIGRQKLVVAVPKDHPLAIKDSVDLRDTIDIRDIFFKGRGLRPVVVLCLKKLTSFRRSHLRWRRTRAWQGLWHRDLE